MGSAKGPKGPPRFPLSRRNDHVGQVKGRMSQHPSLQVRGMRWAVPKGPKGPPRFPLSRRNDHVGFDPAPHLPLIVLQTTCPLVQLLTAIKALN